MTQISASLENAMNEHFGSSPEWCRRCDSPVWANEEDEVLVDSRELTGLTADNPSYPGLAGYAHICPGTNLPHQV